ncbi:MAG: Flp pilus assembly protein CpaB [Pseudomonadota bacterium]
MQRNWIIIGVAVIVGLFAVVLVNAYFSGVKERDERTAIAQQMTRIVVAVQPLEFGTKLTDQNVRLQTWPASAVPEGAFATIADALKDGRVAVRPMVPNEPVLAHKVSGKDGRATLAALLPDGMRAVSIPIGATTGVSGFVLPGTLVDVLLTRKLPGDGALSEDMRSDVILENVQVLGINQSVNDKSGDPMPGQTATVAVTINDAQRLAIAEKIGALSLALRKVEDSSGQLAVIPALNTVTNRALGHRLVVGGRPSGSTQTVRQLAMPYRPVRPALAGTGAQGGGTMLSGRNMTVVRGVNPTEYPVGNFAGAR